ncbi:hypothetical protein [Parvibaculum sp.]|uniref:hypothetical protein n=1 Tax=Parvibaculum sp. TaxID=2024848 RepID=UPI0027321069|nr:hypothetical protein [Parvibaculum sp.]MDP1627507.1 hypothetical protein [Parvibaculum sp.]MDP2148686.1 hypothetical protein [Parvibaculum sp.]MDP3326712.1 hypothetical protein [Parvibaculum sp.]
MRNLLKLSFGILLAGLAACAPNLESLPTASLKLYKPDMSDPAAAATIRGTFEESTGLLGTPARATGVFAIDGNTAFETRELAAPLPLTPGLHSLTIGYLTGGIGDAVPVKLVAEPGARYVVKRERGTDMMDGLRYDRIRTYVYIEDEKTGEIVVPKTPDVLRSIEGRYAPPTGPDLATMRGTGDDGLLDSFYALLIAVDGEIVRAKKEATLMTVESYEPATPIALTPGLHALAIAVRGGTGTSYLPILFDAKPNVSYVIKYERGLKRHGSVRIFTATVWIENESDGSIALPKTDIPTAYYPVL